MPESAGEQLAVPPELRSPSTASLRRWLQGRGRVALRLRWATPPDGPRDATVNGPGGTRAGAKKPQKAAVEVGGEAAGEAGEVGGVGEAREKAAEAAAAVAKMGDLGEGDGLTAVHIAAYGLQEAALEVLLRAAPDSVHQTDALGRSPLHYVAHGSERLQVPPPRPHLALGPCRSRPFADQYFVCKPPLGCRLACKAVVSSSPPHYLCPVAATGSSPSHSYLHVPSPQGLVYLFTPQPFRTWLQATSRSALAFAPPQSLRNLTEELAEAQPVP